MLESECEGYPEIAMIITEDFIMINFPKTGSSFARKVIKELYSGRHNTVARILIKLRMRESGYTELMLPNIYNARYKFKDNFVKGQHGVISQIPEQYINKPIISIVRNPFSRYISGYQFKWWQKYPHERIEIIKQKYPDFPDITFTEYYDMVHNFGIDRRLRGIKPKIELGLYTIQFIQYFFHDPEEVLRKIDNEYIENELFIKDIGDIHFLRQENLNADLKDYLLKLGVDSEELQFIDTMKKVNVTIKKEQEQNLALILNEEIKNKILEKDKLLFKLFPEYLEYL